jgi:ribosomal-protein-alanine N-acetyltransferase
MHIIAQTPQFVIRNFKPDEEEAYLSLFDDEQVLIHIPKRSRKENMNIFRNALNDYAARKTLGRWGLFNNGDNEYIGLCLLKNFNGEAGKIELGYVLSRKYWGKGIASEMAHKMVAYAFTHTDAQELVAITTLGNIASQRVLEKAGFKRMDNIISAGEEVAYFRIEKPSL